jgi:hypothetical protein
MKPVRDITVLRRKAAAIKDLDKGIKDLLIGLWRWGVETEESCEGHVFRLIPFPFVRFPDKDKENVETILRAYGKCDWEITRALNGSAYYLVHPRIIKGKSSLGSGVIIEPPSSWANGSRIFLTTSLMPRDKIYCVAFFMLSDYKKSHRVPE